MPGFNRSISLLKIKVYWVFKACGLFGLCLEKELSKLIIDYF